MKKRLLAAAVAASMTLSLSVALAAPVVEIDGSAEVKYEWDRYEHADNDEGALNTFILNAKTAVSDNVDFYTRLAVQRYHGFSGDDGYPDFNTKDGSRKSTATIDRFGFILKDDNVTYNLGRQDADLGPNLLLYTTSGNIGSSATLFDGLTTSATLGATELNLLAGQETDTENKLYALHAAYNPTDAWVIGGTLARYDYDGVSAGGKDKTNHWGIDTAYTYGSTTYFAEYAKSNEDVENKAFLVGVTHELDDRNSIGLTYAKVEALGDINGNTDFDAGLKGLYFSFDHKLSEKTTLNLSYKDLKEIGGSEKQRAIETTVTYAF